MNYKTFIAWKHVMSFMLGCIFFCSMSSQAQTTFTHGIAATGSTVLWFKPDVSIAWVDVHFSTGGAQQNIRMTSNATTGRFEQIISANSGTVVTYSFTYSINGGTGFDTAQFTATVPTSSSSLSSKPSSASSSKPSSASSSKPSSASSSTPSSRSSSQPSNASSSKPSSASSTSSATGITNGVTDNASSVIIWLKPNNVTVEWADVHFTVNNGPQQNIRMTLNTSLARHEKVVTTTAGAALTITYSFTHQTPSGAVDTATFNFTRTSSSSSIVSSKSSSVVSSSKSSISSSRISSSIISSSTSSKSSASSSSISVNVDRSLFIHDAATLQAADFSFRSTLQQLVNQLNAINPGNQTTVEQLFARMWDTQNPVPGRVVGGEKCTGVLNGFSIECRPAEGSQADSPEAFISNYAPIGLVNRFDLRDNVTFNDCGEYRVIYANQGGNRNFLIFEAQMPNPNPGVASGCLPIAQFWRNLSTENSTTIRASNLRNFYFNGIPAANVRPVIDIRNYAVATGQIRANMFLFGGSWNLKEFKVAIDAQGLSMIKPVSVKSNPVAALFSGSNPDTRAPVFQSDFINNMDSLLKSFDDFSLTVAKDAHNNGQSHASFPIFENEYNPAFFNTSSSTFQQAVNNKLTTAGSNLTSAQVMNRATAMTCGGCHEPSSFGLTSSNAIGPNQTWPGTLGFTHISEFANNGVFPLSPALINVFLPARLAGFNNFLANQSFASPQSLTTSPTTNSTSTLSVSSSSSSSSSAPAKAFNKRAG